MAPFGVGTTTPEAVSVIPSQVVKFHSQDRTFNLKLVPAMTNFVRRMSISIQRKHHDIESFDKSGEALTDLQELQYAESDINQAVQALIDEIDGVGEAIKTLAGESYIPITSHPLIAQAQQLRSMASALDSSFEATELDETLAELEEYKSKLDSALTVANSRTKSATTAVKITRIMLLARIKNTGEALGLFPSTTKIPPAVEFERIEFKAPSAYGEATFDPKSLVDSPERNASVLVTQCRMAVLAQRRKNDAVKKKQERQRQDDTLHRLKVAN